MFSRKCLYPRFFSHSMRSKMSSGIFTGPPLRVLSRHPSITWKSYRFIWSISKKMIFMSVFWRGYSGVHCRDGVYMS